MKRFVLLLTSLSVACADLNHVNPLDPENPDAEADQIVVVENFIMHYTDAGTVPDPVKNSQDALYELVSKYGEKMIILEYHMPPYLSANTDEYYLPEDTVRYNQYRDNTPRGFPHVFFNGKQNSAQGASSKTAAKARYEAYLDTMTIRKNRLYCELEKSVSGNTLTIDSRIARFGETSINNLSVEFIVYQNNGDLKNFTVRDVLLPITITNIGAKEVFELNPQTVTLGAKYTLSDVGVVMIVKDNVSKQILQATIQ